MSSPSSGEDDQVLSFRAALPATRELTSRMTARRSFSGSWRTSWNFFRRRRTSGSSGSLAALGGGLRPKSGSAETFSALAISTTMAVGGYSATVS